MMLNLIVKLLYQIVKICLMLIGFSIMLGLRISESLLRILFMMLGKSRQARAIQHTGMPPSPGPIAVQPRQTVPELPVYRPFRR